MSYYLIENHHQDGERCFVETYRDRAAALARAREMARDAICYGMVRVVAAETIVSYSAGELRDCPDPGAPVDPAVAFLKATTEF
jgi:hypothetical protein